MKNPLITEDCYVNVEGWSGEAILKAAQIFQNSTQGEVVSFHWLVQRDRTNRNFLMVLKDRTIFVGNPQDLELHNRTKEITKDQVFNPEKYLQGITQEIQVLFHMDIIDRAAEAVHKLHTMTSSVEDTRKLMMFAVKDALGRLQKNLEENPEYDRSVSIQTGHWQVSLDWFDENTVELNVTVKPVSIYKSPMVESPLKSMSDSFSYFGDY